MDQRLSLFLYVQLSCELPHANSRHAYVIIAAYLCAHVGLRLWLQMLMVLFDILVSHRRMSRWHEKRIQSHLRDQQATQQAKQELQRRLDSNSQTSTSQASHAHTVNGQSLSSQALSSRQAPGNDGPSDPVSSVQQYTTANGNVSRPSNRFLAHAWMLLYHSMLLCSFTCSFMGRSKGQHVQHCTSSMMASWSRPCYMTCLV